MTERRVDTKSGKNNDKRGEQIDPIRLAELYPSRENEVFWKYVESMKQNGRSEFAVSKAKTKLDRDLELRFFRIKDSEIGEHPNIIFLGKNVARGSIEIWNSYAAESYGFNVLSLAEVNAVERKYFHREKKLDIRR